MKKTIALLLALALLLCGAGCGKKEKSLTLDTVRSLAAEKGEALTWRDFESYESTETGSGLYIRVYEIDADYRLMIGGTPDETPMYIYLLRAADDTQRIDIRYDDIDAFLNEAK